MIPLLFFFASLQDEFIQRIVPFDKEYQSFKLTLIGCPESFQKLEPPLDISKCDPRNGTINVKSWLLLRKLAAKTFELQEINSSR